MIRAEPEHMSNNSDEIISHISTNKSANASNAHELESLRSTLHEVHLEIEQLTGELLNRDEMIEKLHEELSTATTEVERLTAAAVLATEVETLCKELKVQTAKAKRFWSQKCEQLLLHEVAIEEKEDCIAVKDTEIARLQAELESLRTRRLELATNMLGVQAESRDAGLHSISNTELSLSHMCHGKAPPIDPFHGNDPDVRLDDWLATLERAAIWNGWSDDEKLMQLAGHLRGKAAREYALLSPEEKRSFALAVQALRAHLESGRYALAAQDFQNAIQREKESVPDYISRLEQSFQFAYGHKSLTMETRDTLLFG